MCGNSQQVLQIAQSQQRCCLNSLLSSDDAWEGDQLPQEARRYGVVTCQALWCFFAQLLPGLTWAWSAWGNAPHMTYSVRERASKQDQQVSYWNTVQWCKCTNFLAFALQISRSHRARSSGGSNLLPSPRTVKITHYPSSHPVRFKGMTFGPDKVCLLKPSTHPASDCQVIHTAYVIPRIFVQLNLGENTF